MNLYRVWAIFMRYFYFFTRLDNIAEVFYWPTIDIFLWGITTVWIQTQEAAIPDLALAILTGLVFWQVLWRGNYEITVNILQEFWNRNLVNLFSTPLRLREWMAATMLVGIVKIIVTVIFCALLLWIFFVLNIFSIGPSILAYIALLTLSGWMIGFITGAVMVYYGQRLQMLAWITPFMIAPFSAVFYPVSALPDWGQTIAWCLPTTYVFEGMRLTLSSGEFSLFYFWMSLGLNVLFLSGSMALFTYLFEKSRNKGLARLE